ncbi:hypothetical protein BDZ91DRAFT_788609 [Kalaharituber pfeilii]|nr:hypothetical protein BDZ91DRAFT_788609 [Kalaharituber pfeilii]
MSISSDLSQFIHKSKLDPDGSVYIETTFMGSFLFKAWSIDCTTRHISHYKTIPHPNMLHEDSRSNGVGALSLEKLIRRQIVQHHLQDLTMEIIGKLEWYGRGKKLWDDTLSCGMDSFRVFSIFCSAYGHEPDFVPMLERDPQGTWSSGSRSSLPFYASQIQSNEETWAAFVPAPNFYGNQYVTFAVPEHDVTRSKYKSIITRACTFRYRIQLIKNPLPPWHNMLPLLTAPTPKANNYDFSWLVCLEITTQPFDGKTWGKGDLSRSFGELPNLAVLSIHGPAFYKEGFRIVRDGHLGDWARSARVGNRWGSLRILVLEEKLDGLIECYMPRPKHHTYFRLYPKAPSPPPKRTIFEDLDSFPMLSVVAFHFIPPPLGWTEHDMRFSPEREDLNSYSSYPWWHPSKKSRLVQEGAKLGWFAERATDITGTLKGRPTEVRFKVKEAEMEGMRQLAEACSVLVQVERREREEIIREKEDTVNGTSGSRVELEERLKKCKWAKEHTGEESESEDVKVGRTISSNKEEEKLPLPPVMVNVVFESTKTPDSNATSASSRSEWPSRPVGSESQLDAQGSEETQPHWRLEASFAGGDEVKDLRDNAWREVQPRKIIFEKKREVRIAMQHSEKEEVLEEDVGIEAGVGAAGRKRKGEEEGLKAENGDESRDGEAPLDNGTAKKARIVRSGKAKTMGDMLREFM